MQPLISVCIPAYNVENYIEECLNSIINQPFTDYEIVLVDNGSDDRTPEICAAYAEKYPHIITFEALERPTLLGRAAVRAIVLSRGEYVISVDSDDYLAPEALSLIGKVAYDKHPDLIMIDYKCIAEEGLIARNNPPFDASRINDVPYLDAIKYITGQNTFLASMWMYAIKTDANARKRMNDMKAEGTVNGDTSAVLSLFISFESIHYIDQKLYYYRLRHGSISTMAKSNQHAKGLFYAIVELMNFLSYKSEVFTTKDLIEVTYTLLLRYFKISLSDFEYLEEDVEDVANKLDALKSKLSVIKQLPYPLFSVLYENIMSFGAKEGLIKTIEFENQTLVNRVKSLEFKELFVVPTGGYGENAAKILSAHNIPVTGFLDNSETKNQLKIDNLLCQLPSSLLEKNNKENIAIVIASVYENHTESIMKQMLSLGISEQNIILRSELND